MHLPLSLSDTRNDMVYVPMSGSLWRTLQEGWSEPVQAKVEQGELVFRSLTPVDSKLFAAPDETGRS